MSATATRSGPPVGRPAWKPAAESQRHEGSIETRGPILVATDGTAVSDPALATAQALSRALDTPVQLVSIVEPGQSLVPGPDLTGLTAADRERGEERLNAVRAQRDRFGVTAEWTTEIKYGDAPQMLARLAKTRGARVLIMGRRAHGRVDRLLGDDTVFDVLRLAETPVLVVTEPLNHAPRVMTIAVEFSQLSMNAARSALDLFPSAGLAYLVHVRPQLDVTMGTDTEHPETVKAGFANLLRALEDSRHTRLDAVSLSGVPARELVDFAANARSDLLVLGSFRRGLFRRLIGGGMATRVLGHAACPVLIVPEAPLPQREEVIELLKDHALGTTLHDVTLRNSGRKVLFETDNVRAGAQVAAFDYLFISSDFDLEADELRILLADDAERPVHRVMHLMGRPATIDIRRAFDGRDHVVRIVDSAGEATLTFW